MILMQGYKPIASKFLGWFEFVVDCCPGLDGFSLGLRVSLLPQKPTFQISIDSEIMDRKKHFFLIIIIIIIVIIFIIYYYYYYYYYNYYYHHYYYYAGSYF